jgi:HD-like signal output (HDOD) protein
MSDGPSRPGAPLHPHELPLVEQIELEIRSGKVELPVLSDSARRIRESIEREEGMGHIVAIIEREPPVAATLLRYANSIAFAGLDGVGDLHRAVARLGPGVGERLIEAWDLPAAIRDVMRHRDDATMTAATPRLAAIVALAHRITESLAAPGAAADPEALASSPAAAMLGLDAGAVAERMAEIAGDLGSAQEMFLAA